MHPVAMSRRNNERIASQSKFIKIRNDSGIFHALCLVHRQNDRAAGFAQIVRNGLVMRCDSLTSIDDENNDIRFGDGLLRLLRHLLHDAFLDDRLEPTGIDDQKRAIPHSAFTIVAVAGQAGIIGDQRGSRARQAIE